MTETFFAVNDLLRRRLQTSLMIIALTVCVASSVFLVLFTQSLHSSIPVLLRGRLTSGFNAILSQYSLFVVALIFVTGLATASFLGHLMMFQRVKDIGLMKMAGCPSYLVLGYFMNELILVTVAGCFLGSIIGVAADYLSSSVAPFLGLTIQQTTPDFLSVIAVSVSFFLFTILLGGSPIIRASRDEPVKTASPLQYAGTFKERGFRAVSSKRMEFELALRSLARRKTVSIRIILCLATVFVLVTISVFGGIVAQTTTNSWIEGAIDRNNVMVANNELIRQYRQLLLGEASQAQASGFQYSKLEYSLPSGLVERLSQIGGASAVDQRLVLYSAVQEVHNYTIDPETLATTLVGDDRRGESLIIGIDPNTVANRWFMKGRLFSTSDRVQAVVGDTLAISMFSAPLQQSIRVQNTTLVLTGVCIDPLNHGNVTYIPLQTLEKITSIKSPNMLIIHINDNSNLTSTKSQINNILSTHPTFAMLDLNEPLDDDLHLSSQIWSAVMFPPLFSLLAATLCLFGYVTLGLCDERHELGILRALGAKPNSLARITLWQVLIVLLSGYATGIAFGIMTTLMILIPDPVVTQYDIAKTVLLLLAVFVAILVTSTYPILKFSKEKVLSLLEHT
jgi:ABC-type antimicrobial peptide transport system permease subunit